MPLLFLDLDNTLVDREAAYRAWATSYLAERGSRADLLEAMVLADGDGLRYKPEVADDLAELLGLSPQDKESIVKVLRAGVVAHLSLVPGAAEALASAREAGWTPFIVTNGVEAQQEAKIRGLGLDAMVAGWVISDACGVRKPDPTIFDLAAQQAGEPLAGAWMIGDSAEADIAGAHAAGLRSVYLPRGRAWTADVPPATADADSLVEAVRLVLAWEG